jgi:hypothetical protein
MIIFYNKKTGEIFGTISGRVHDEDQIKNAMMKPENVDVEDVGKWVAPFKAVFETIYEPIIEQRVVDTKTMRVEGVVIGKKKIQRGIGMIPDGKFSKLIEKFDKDSSEVYKYKIKTNKKGDIADFVEK